MFTTMVEGTAEDWGHIAREHGKMGRAFSPQNPLPPKPWPSLVPRFGQGWYDSEPSALKRDILHQPTHYFHPSPAFTPLFHHPLCFLARPESR